MTSGSSPMSPFVAGPMITNPQRFVGRKDELHAITSRMVGVQPISVNVVGDRRSGKSSLLYHFFQTYEQRVSNPDGYVVVYLSCQEAQCQHENDFYQAVAQKLLSRPFVQANTALTTPLQITPLDRQSFSNALEEWKRQGVLPVLCLDAFETLLGNRTEFNDGFYDNLRSLMDRSVLMLVVASGQQLDVYRRKYKLTSDFFNLGHVIKLGELTEDEAKDLVCLPASTVLNTQAALGPQEQKIVREWGGRHPYLLQLAGDFIYQARQPNRELSWAKAQFEQQASRVPRGRFNSSQWWSPLRWVFWDVPVRLGRLAKIIGGTVDDIGNWIIGLVILVAVIVVLLRVVPWEQVKDLLQKAVGG